MNDSSPDPVVYLPPVAAVDNDDAAVAAVAAPPPPPRPWGIWATVGWTLLACLIGMIAMFIAAVAMGVVIGVAGVAATGGDFDIQQWIAAHNGMIEMLAYVPMAIVTLAFLAVPIWMRRFRYGPYVSLGRVPMRRYVVTMIVMLSYLVLLEVAGIVTNRPVPQWMVDTWATSGSGLLMLAVVVLVAPLAEEVLFRGFVYRGFEGTAMGAALPIIVTSIMWAVIHVQYGLVEIAMLFVAGLLLGWSRHWTGSIRPAILMHMTMNIVAMTLFIVFHAK